MLRIRLAPLTSTLTRPSRAGAPPPTLSDRSPCKRRDAPCPWTQTGKTSCTAHLSTFMPTRPMDRTMKSPYRNGAARRLAYAPHSGAPDRHCLDVRDFRRMLVSQSGPEPRLLGSVGLTPRSAAKRGSMMTRARNIWTRARIPGQSRFVCCIALFAGAVLRYRCGLQVAVPEGRGRSIGNALA